MATKGKMWLFSALLLLLVGCAPVSILNPLYTSKDIVFDEHLLGSYVGEKETDKDSGIAIDKSGENGYQITITDSGKKTVFDAFLLNLNGHRFLDVAPSEYVASPGSYRIHFDRSKTSLKPNPALVLLENGVYLELTPGATDAKSADVNVRVRVAHMFFKVFNDEKSLRLDYVDDDWLKKAIENKTIQTPHALITNDNSEELVWTASTQELQQFLIEHMNDDQLFSESIRLKKAGNGN